MSLVDYMLLINGPSSSMNGLRALRVLRALRLIKLAKLLRSTRIFKRYETRFAIDYQLLELVKCILAGDRKLGAHHGVVLLAVANLLKFGVPLAQRLLDRGAKED